MARPVWQSGCSNSHVECIIFAALLSEAVGQRHRGGHVNDVTVTSLSRCLGHRSRQAAAAAAAATAAQASVEERSTGAERTWFFARWRYSNISQPRALLANTSEDRFHGTREGSPLSILQITSGPLPASQQRRLLCL